MTDFKQDRAIYLQMAERICDEILAGKYNADDRIPSVRELAVLLEVNTNIFRNNRRSKKNQTNKKFKIHERKPP